MVLKCQGKVGKLEWPKFIHFKVLSISRDIPENISNISNLNSMEPSCQNMGALSHCYAFRINIQMGIF